MISEQLKQLAASHGVSASAIARHCGVSAQAACNWINGKGEPKGGHKLKLAEFFKISVQALEYGPILSLNQLHALNDEMPYHPEFSEQAAELIMTAGIEPNQPRSAAFREGMRDRIILKLHGKDRPCPFPIGSPEFDAYQFGAFQGENLIDRLKFSSTK